MGTFACLTFVTVAVPTAGDDDGIRHDVLAYETQQLIRNRVVFLGGRRRLLW